MRVVLTSYGSRGDVEPMAGLAVALEGEGAEVVVCAPGDEEFVALLARAGVPMAPAFMGVREWVAAARTSGMGLREFAKVMVKGQVEAISAAAAGADAIVATGLFPSVAASQIVAETIGARFLFTSFCPLLLPSPAHAPFEYPGQTHPEGMSDNEALWDFNIGAMQSLFGEAVNGQRAALVLPVVDNLRDHVFTRRPLLASDAVLGPWTSSALCDAVQTGAWILPDERALPDALLAFLDAGEPPVYVGFGSMAMAGSTDVAEVAIAAVRAQGRRIVLARGWAGLAASDDFEDCFVTGEVNQQALFRRVAAVVHHGGAGTTTTAARAGAPQVIVPQVVDQPYWGGRIEAIGIGVAVKGPVATVEGLSGALERALGAEVSERARAVAGTIRTDGAEVAAKLIMGRA